MYSSAGKVAYTESVLNILLSSLQTQPKPQTTQAQQTSAQDHTNCPQAAYMKRQAQQTTTQDHTNCPQAAYMKKQKNRYNNIEVSNKFSPLTNFQGNF